MTNKEKFDEHNKLIAEYEKRSFCHAKPSVFKMEKLKYSDNELDRQVCAYIQYADNMFTKQLLGEAG